MLNRVSRSFAVVIQSLPTELRDAVCLFYLVLRALDTVEDDMAVAVDVKVPLLRVFHEKIYDRSWKMSCGYGPYVDLMQQYPLVTDAFLRIKPMYQKVIADITRRMGEGMAEFIEKEVLTVKEYDLYCHYVAGLVGIGLSQLFASSQLESEEFANMEDLANHMGLFLQKTNIIRDYLEDINEEPAPRMFWPKEVWGRYARRLDAFKAPENAAASLGCLNELVTDALRHAPHSLAYMAKLRNHDVFRFCAIPQVMAIGTLALCYNNRGVFTGVVKMRRGETAKYVQQLCTMADLHQAFDRFAGSISARASELVNTDKNAKLALRRAAEIQEICQKGLEQFPAARKLPQLSRVQVLWKALAYYGLGYQARAHLPELWQQCLAYVLIFMLFAYTVLRRAKW
ncbi:g8429 [Coccomyxa elongata]